MLISQSKKFIFLHIPKTAGISLRTALAEHADTYKIDTYSAAAHMQQSHIRKLALIDDFQGYYEFAVVREPLERLVAMFNYQLQWQPNYNTFRQFVQYVKQTYQHKTPDNLFYHSQIEWLNQPLTEQVHVYKFENIILDTGPLQQVLGIDINLAHDNKNKNKVLTVTDLSSKEIKYCLDFLSEEYNRLDYVKP